MLAENFVARKKNSDLNLLIFLAQITTFGVVEPRMRFDVCWFCQAKRALTFYVGNVQNKFALLEVAESHTKWFKV